MPFLVKAAVVCELEFNATTPINSPRFDDSLTLFMQELCWLKELHGRKLPEVAGLKDAR